MESKNLLHRDRDEKCKESAAETGCDEESAFKFRKLWKAIYCSGSVHYTAGDAILFN